MLTASDKYFLSDRKKATGGSIGIGLNNFHLTINLRQRQCPGYPRHDIHSSSPKQNKNST